MDVLEENGRMHGCSEDGPSTSTGGGHLLPDDSASGWDSHSPEGQPSTSGNSINTVAAPGGPYPANCQAAQGVEPNVLIIEVEGFQVGKDFFVKELAFYNPALHMTWQGLFKPPFDKRLLKKKGQNCIDFCTENFHGIKWESGDYPYCALYSVISHFADGFVLYAKGDQKCQWIQQFTTAPIINLEQLGCPPAKQLPHECLCHLHNTFLKDCALDKAVRLGKFYARMYNMVPPIAPNNGPQIKIDSGYASDENSRDMI